MALNIYVTQTNTNIKRHVGQGYIILAYLYSTI